MWLLQFGTNTLIIHKGEITDVTPDTGPDAEPGDYDSFAFRLADGRTGAVTWSYVDPTRLPVLFKPVFLVFSSEDKARKAAEAFKAGCIKDAEDALVRARGLTITHGRKAAEGGEHDQ
jgi:hypothetical protein